MKKALIYALAVVLFSALAALSAVAAPIEQGQFDQQAFYHQARYAKALEANPAITEPRSVFTKLYASRASYGDEEYIWLWEECADSTKLCYWDERKVKAIGSAESGQGADVLTTAVGLGLGGAEANPLGLAILPIKAAMIYQSRSADFQTCVSYRAPTAAVGWGAGIANGIGIAAFVAGSGVGLPVSLGLLALASWLAWDTEQALFECANFALSTPPNPDQPAFARF